MQLTFTTINEFLIVDVSGVVDSHAAGRLLDALIEAARSGGDKLIVDLSGVPTITHAGVRGLVVAAKLSLTAGGRMRICGASASVEAMLRSLGYDHLLKFDRTVEASIAALSPGFGPTLRSERRAA